MIKKLVIAFFLGVIGLLCISQKDAWIRQACAERIRDIFKETLGANFSATIDRIDFFSPACECVDVSVRPMDNDSWAWHAKRLTVYFSWWEFLWSRVIGFHIVVEGFQGLSTKKGKVIPLFDHGYQLMTSTTQLIPSVVKSICLKPASVMISDSDDDIIFFLKWHSESQIGTTSIKSNVYCLNGKLSIAGVDYLSKAMGTLNIELSKFESMTNYNGQIKGVATALCSGGQREPLFITGSWNGASGMCLIKNEDQSIKYSVSDMKRIEGGFYATVQAQAPIQDIAHWVTPTWPMNGTACVQGVLTIKDFCVAGFDGEMIVNNWKIHDCFCVNKLTTTIHKHDSVWSGHVAVCDNDQQQIEGTWQWNEQTASAQSVVKLMRPYSIPGKSHWFVDAEHAQVRIEKDIQGAISGMYSAGLVDQSVGDEASVMGTFVVRDTQCDISGRINDHIYEGSVCWVRPPYLTKLLYVDNTGKKQIDCALSSNNVQELKGIVSFEGINMLTQHFFGFQLDGQGTLQFTLQNNDCISIQAHLADAVVRVPHLYNVMNGLDMTVKYDIHAKKGDMRNFRCALDRGDIKCRHATMMFDDNYQVAFFHVPVLVNECLLNVNKDLFALMSARLVCEKKNGAMPSITGSVILERSQMKENIFSSEFQQKIVQCTESAFNTAKMDMSCAISVETATPTYVETAFLETNAQCAMMVNNTLRDPCITGSMNIGTGTLYFPYKSLQITKGSLYFVPNQMNDPLIELVAKNKIKKYNVTLNVTGSLNNHQISLESTPPLTEEQIMALLLIGSPEESLNIVMPALIMSNLTSLIFGGGQSRDSVDSSFRRLFKPFDHIHLVPSFTDQTGRGGLRGAIEIDVTDRLHALIQKNFSLSEDTRVEVEYLLSDDISVRAIRNERRDVGGEVEMRWKF